MRLVIDASVVVAVCYAAGELGALRGHELRAPAHLAAEVTSSIREQAFRGDIPAERAGEAISYLRRVPLQYDEPGRRAPGVLERATSLGWAKTYDAEYVELARVLDAPLVTLDGRLRRGAARVVEVLAPTEVAAA